MNKYYLRYLKYKFKYLKYGGSNNSIDKQIEDYRKSSHDRYQEYLKDEGDQSLSESDTDTDTDADTDTDTDDELMVYSTTGDDDQPPDRDGERVKLVNENKFADEPADAGLASVVTAEQPIATALPLVAEMFPIGATTLVRFDNSSPRSVGEFPEFPQDRPLNDRNVSDRAGRPFERYLQQLSYNNPIEYIRFQLTNDIFRLQDINYILFHTNPRWEIGEIITINSICHDAKLLLRVNNIINSDSGRRLRDTPVYRRLSTWKIYLTNLFAELIINWCLSNLSIPEWYNYFIEHIDTESLLSGLDGLSESNNSISQLKPENIIISSTEIFGISSDNDKNKIIDFIFNNSLEGMIIKTASGLLLQRSLMELYQNILNLYPSIDEYKNLAKSYISSKESTEKLLKNDINKPNSIQLFVKTLTGKTYIIQLPNGLNTSVNELKFLIEFESGIPASNINLVFNRRKLGTSFNRYFRYSPDDDSDTISNYGIQSNDTLHLILR